MTRSLILLGGKNHPHQACGKILADHLNEMPGHEVVATEDAKRLTRLGGFDAVVLYCNAGFFTPAQERGLVRFVEEGGGLVGLHHCNSVMGKRSNDAYLEMLAVSPEGEFFSRGLDSALTGTTDWTAESISFDLREGQNPTNVKMNLVVDGTGTVWIDDAKLLKAPLKRQSD